MSLSPNSSASAFIPGTREGYTLTQGFVGSALESSFPKNRTERSSTIMVNSNPSCAYACWHAWWKDNLWLVSWPTRKTNVCGYILARLQPDEVRARPYSLLKFASMELMGAVTSIVSSPIVNKVKNALSPGEPANAADMIIKYYIHDSPAFHDKKFASKGTSDKWLVPKVREARHVSCWWDSFFSMHMWNDEQNMFIFVREGLAEFNWCSRNQTRTYWSSWCGINAMRDRQCFGSPLQSRT